MKIKLSSEWIYQLLFFVAVIFSYITNYELSLLVWLVILMLTVKRFYSKSILIYISLFVIILAIGCIRSLYYDHSTYNILRDISYFIKPIVGLLIGYQCFRTKENNFFRTIIYSAFGIAIYHFITLFIGSFYLPLNNLHDIRHIGGYFSDFETFAFVILLFHKKFELNFSQKKLWFFTGIIGLSLLLYFARTNFIQLFILICGMFGLYQITKKKLIILSSLLLIIGVGYKIVYDMNPTRNGKGLDAFLYKVKNAPTEIYDPYVVNDNSSRFHDNFRSFETKVTIAQVVNRGDYGVWLGNGFGSSVNYGSLMWTNDGNYIRHAPILHNGYSTIFLKTGIVGLSIFVFSMVYLSFVYKTSDISLHNNIKLLVNSTGIFLFISTLVFLGYYLKLDNKSLFVGGLIAYYEIITKTDKSIT
ncbi:hypothetical protein [Faecalibacter bovis]|uniref:O-antigen ligase domain-containing protein n=1 Tax=Faecalibacter bovis TaxID=2898187 RepID=A0ABX7XFG9_9FLAO|nr:hypothetical protein [Faecalibacter bovis]QTV06691.1 hypothetical protein J9309_05075 [Faecalibacter bovis]